MAAIPQESDGALRALAHNRPLLRAVAAALFVFLAEYTVWITTLVYAFNRGGSSAAGLIALAQLLPAIVLAPVIGSLLARLGLERLLTVTILVQALMMLTAAGAAAVGASALIVYGALIVSNTFLSISLPALFAAAPLLVRLPEELAAANAAHSTAEGIAALAGPLGAGLLIALSGTAAAFAVAGAMALAATALAWVPLRKSGISEDEDELEGEEAEPGLRDLLAAVRLVLRRPTTRAVLLYPLGAAAIEGAADLLVVILAVDVLQLGEGAAGYLSAAFGLGGLLGAIAAGLFAGRRLAGPLAVSTLLGSVALASLALASTTAVAVVLLVLVGGLRVMQLTTAQTLLQRSTPLHLLVHVFSLFESVTNAGLAIGSLLVPLLIGLGGASAAFVGMAAIAPLVVALTARRLRQVDDEADVPVVEMGLLRSLRIFAALPGGPLELLARASEHRTRLAGETLVQEGEIGDEYYAIVDGDVAVWRDGEVLRRLERGEGFGEIALIDDVPRTATVTAESRVRLLCVDREAFLTAVGAHAAVRKAARRIADRRIADA